MPVTKRMFVAKRKSGGLFVRHSDEVEVARQAERTAREYDGLALVTRHAPTFIQLS